MARKTKAEKQREEREKRIKNSLIAQLENKGANLAHFEDLIADYMRLFRIKDKLQEDIDKRGVVYEGMNSSGFPVEKNNPSINDLVKVNRQMLMILKELDLSTETVPPPEEDGNL